MKNIEELFSFIESFTNLEKSHRFFGREYQLDRMIKLCSLFSDPHRAYPVIHVAGTKGKGSTAAFIASAFSAAGCRTGLYTSPHVSSYRERIMIDGEYADDNPLLGAGCMIREKLAAHPDIEPTTFELLTLLAFLVFRDAGCMMAVIETGIGGRLDATNVVYPLASVITPIDLDHTDVLGNTFAEIAREKAGIIKKGVPVFSARQVPEAKEVLVQTALNQGAAISFIDDVVNKIDVRLSRLQSDVTIVLKRSGSFSCTLSMPGYFQADNAALAYLVLSSLRKQSQLQPYPQSGLLNEITEEKICAGFRKARLPGRFEIINTKPVIVLDAAHTPLSVARLLESFQSLFPGKAVLLFGSIKGKNHREMAGVLSQAFPVIIISTPGQFKESEPGNVYASFKAQNPDTILEPDPVKAFEKAIGFSGGKIPVLVTGSFYMIAEIRKLIPADM